MYAAGSSTDNTKLGTEGGHEERDPWVGLLNATLDSEYMSLAPDDFIVANRHRREG